MCTCPALQMAACPSRCCPGSNLYVKGYKVPISQMGLQWVGVGIKGVGGQGRADERSQKGRAMSRGRGGELQGGDGHGSHRKEKVLERAGV